jgi:hypothetical protein
MPYCLHIQHSGIANRQVLPTVVCLSLLCRISGIQHAWKTQMPCGSDTLRLGIANRHAFHKAVALWLPALIAPRPSRSHTSGTQHVWQTRMPCD